jgi:hypothetical protein
MIATLRRRKRRGTNVTRQNSVTKDAPKCTLGILLRRAVHKYVSNQMFKKIQ